MILLAIDESGVLYFVTPVKYKIISFEPFEPSAQKWPDKGVAINLINELEGLELL